MNERAALDVANGVRVCGAARAAGDVSAVNYLFFLGMHI